MEYLMPLREKYLTMKEPVRCGIYKSRTGNSKGPTPKRIRHKSGMGPRRRQGLGSISIY